MKEERRIHCREILSQLGPVSDTDLGEHKDVFCVVRGDVGLVQGWVVNGREARTVSSRHCT